MDEFYDLIKAQQADPEFDKLSRLSAGMLTRRLIDVEDGHEDEEPGMPSSGDEDDHPVFHVSLTSSGRLSVGYSDQIPTEAILSLLDTVREIVESNAEDDD